MSQIRPDENNSVKTIIEKDSKIVSLTGIKPTGSPHLGNYVGAILPAIKASRQNDVEGLYFIADYHALISCHDGKTLKDDIYDVAACWLSSGLDVNKNILYLQSQIPEITELTWILNCFTSKGLMNRAHAYKAKLQANLAEKRDPDADVNMGLYSYPILMAADILFAGAHQVPVGSDQLQHVEIARDIAMTFNHKYGDILTLPTAVVDDNADTVPGLDGRKMSKSYGNHIPLLLPEKKLRKLVMKITTDSRLPEEPKEPEGIIMDIYKFFATPEEIEQLAKRYREGIGWGEAKEILYEKINEHVTPIREKYEHYKESPEKIDAILREGAERLRPRAKSLLLEIKKAIGVYL